MVLSVGSSVIMSKRKSTAGTPSLRKYFQPLQVSMLHSVSKLNCQAICMIMTLAIGCVIARADCSIKWAWPK